MDDKQFICNRCGYETEAKQALIKHLLRKNACEPNIQDIDQQIQLKELQPVKRVPIDETEKKYACPGCFKAFRHSPNMYAHKRICKAIQQKKTDPIIQTPTVVTTTNDVESLKSHIRMLEEKIMSQSKPQNITNNIQIINNNLNLNSFGKETKDHITSEFLTKCLLNTDQGIKDLLTEIHFNPDVPENKNIRVKSKKQNLMETYNDQGEWMAADKTRTLDELIQKGYKIMFSHFINTKETDNVVKEREEALTEWLQKVGLKSGKPNEYYQLRRDMFVLILNNTLYVVGKV